MASERVIVLVLDFHQTVVSCHFGGAISTSQAPRWSGGAVKSLGSDDDRRHDFFDFEFMSELFRRGPSVGVITGIATNLSNRYDCYSPEDAEHLRSGTGQPKFDCERWISGRRAVFEWLKLLYPSAENLHRLLPEELVQAIAPTAASAQREYENELARLKSTAPELSADERRQTALEVTGKNRHIANIINFLRSTRHPTADAYIGQIDLATQVAFFDDRPPNVDFASDWGVGAAVQVNPTLGYGLASNTWPAMVRAHPLLAEVHERLWPSCEPENLHALLHPRAIGSTTREGSPYSSASSSRSSSPQRSAPSALDTKATMPFVGATHFANEPPLLQKVALCAMCNNATRVTCGGCRVEQYCGDSCAALHWNSAHKNQCKRSSIFVHKQTK